MRERKSTVQWTRIFGKLCGHSGCPEGGRLAEGSVKDGEHRGF